MTTVWSIQGPRQWETPHHPPYLLNAHLTYHSHSWSCFKDIALIEEKDFVETIKSIHDWTQLSLLLKFKILTGQCGDLLILWSLKVSLIHKFSCLLKLTLTNLEWCCLFFGCLFSIQIQGTISDFTKELLRVWTNNVIVCYYF